jgi:uncharacterized RDD family membrane protein YckC
MAYGPPTTLDPTNVMGRRITAWFIDAFIPLVIALVVGWSVFVGAATKTSGVPAGYCTQVHFQSQGVSCVQLGNDVYVATSGQARHAFAVGGLIYLIGAVNLFVLQGLTGAAIGKHMLGLRVVRADGNIAGFGWNALRTLLLVVDQFFCALPGIITASVTHPHRRIGDFAAGTFVVAKQSVGTPIAAAVGYSGYPPPWTPPGGAPGWGPPPAGVPGPYGAPTWGAGSAPTQAPTAAPPTAARPTWGTPGAAPPPAQAPTGWGVPAVSPPLGADQPETAASEQAGQAGWAAPSPQPAATPEPTPAASAPPASAPAQPQAAPAPREPQWDAQRNAWVFWEAETNRWLQHDPSTGQWGPLR